MRLLTFPADYLIESLVTTDTGAVISAAHKRTLSSSRLLRGKSGKGGGSGSPDSGAVPSIEVVSYNVYVRKSTAMLYDTQVAYEV